MNTTRPPASNSKRNSVLLMLLVVLIAIAVGVVRTKNRPEVTSNDSTHKWLLIDQVFDSASLDRLREISQTGTFETKTTDPYNVESAGEAVPAGHPDCDQYVLNYLKSSRSFFFKLIFYLF